MFSLDRISNLTQVALCDLYVGFIDSHVIFVTVTPGNLNWLKN